MLPPGILRTTMGLYVLEHDTHLSRWVENCGRLDIPYNVEQVRNLAHLVPAGGVVVNAGASLGDHALIYSQLVGSDGMVYAFEPHPLTAQALTLNMARLANVAVSSLGLSDVPRHARFACDPNIGASSVDPQGDVSVDLVTLDGWLLPILYRDRRFCGAREPCWPSIDPRSCSKSVPCICGGRDHRKRHCSSYSQNSVIASVRFRTMTIRINGMD